MDRPADAATSSRLSPRMQCVPSFVSASALTELALPLAFQHSTWRRKGLSDPDPMVRIGALDMLEGVPPDAALAACSPLLSDAVPACA